MKVGTVHANEISLRVLSGRGMPGGKGLCDLYLTKRELAIALVDFAVEQTMEEKVIGILKEWCNDALTYQAWVTNRQSSFGTLKVSSQMLVKLFEDPCNNMF